MATGAFLPYQDSKRCVETGYKLEMNTLAFSFIYHVSAISGIKKNNNYSQKNFFSKSEYTYVLKTFENLTIFYNISLILSRL